MIRKTLSPTAQGNGRAPESAISLAAIGSEINPKAPKIQEIRAAFVARHCNISQEIARIVAPLAFEEAAE